MKIKYFGTGLIVLLVLCYALQKVRPYGDKKGKEELSSVTDDNSKRSPNAYQNRNNSNSNFFADDNRNNSAERKIKKETNNPSQFDGDNSNIKSAFNDENYEDWIKLGSSQFVEEKKTNPEKYRAGVEFLVNTLKTGNVDKMLSQASATLYNINDPDLTLVYENILNDSESNISPEGLMRILALYVHQGQPNSPEFKALIEKYRTNSNAAVRSVAEKWQEIR